MGVQSDVFQHIADIANILLSEPPKYVKIISIQGNYKRGKFRSIHPEVFSEKAIPNNKFPNIHRKTPVLESPLNKVAGIQTCNFIKKRLKHRCFPVNTAKLLKHLFKRASAKGCF